MNIFTLCKMQSVPTYGSRLACVEYLVFGPGVMMAWCGRPPGPMWGGKSPGLKRANPELDNDVGYGPRKPAVVMGYPWWTIPVNREKNNNKNAVKLQ